MKQVISFIISEIVVFLYILVYTKPYEIWYYKINTRISFWESRSLGIEEVSYI